MSNPSLQKIIKLTQTQYNTLAGGGTVGDYTGLNDSYLYLIQDNTEYIPISSGNIVDVSSLTLKLKTIQAPTSSSGTSYGTGSSGQVLKSNGSTVYWTSDNDTKNTAGTTNSTSKLYLVGATSQAANPQTYSNSGVYTQNGAIYEGGTTLSEKYLGIGANSVGTKKIAVRFSKSSEAETAVGYYKIATITHSNWSYCSFTILCANSYSGTKFNTLFDVRCADNNTTLNSFAFHIIGGDDISSKLTYLETKSGDNTTKIEIFMRCSRYEHPEFYLLAVHESSILDINSTDWGATPAMADNSTMTGNATNTVQAASLTTSSAGSATNPVYFSSGVPTACTYSLSKSVPSDAVFTDTKNTAGSTNATDKLFLIGAASQAANPQTYSNSNIYMTAGTLYLVKTQDLGGTANNKPALIIGGADTAEHIEIDSNEIHAKATGTTVGPLYLNNDGGIVYFSNANSSSQRAYASAGVLYTKNTEVMPSTGGNYNVTLGAASSGSNKTLTMDGKIVVDPSYHNSNSYNEGIRINKASNDWANVTFGGTAGTTQGTGSGIWLLGRRGAAGSTSGAAGDFTIEHNGSNGTGLTLYANGNRPRWNNNELAYVSELTTDTKNTAGATNVASKLFLIGAGSQAANPQTYSYSTVYETAGTLNATKFTVDADHTGGAIQYNTVNGCMEIIC